jgi:hypothetical protein
MSIGGLLADWNWHPLFLGDGLTTLAFGTLVYFTIPETRPSAVVLAPGAPALRPVADGSALPRPIFDREPANPVRGRVFLATTAAAFLLTLIFCSNLSVLPLTVTQFAGYPAVVFGLLAAVNGILIALFEISITVWLRRFRRLRVAALGAFLVASGFGMIGLVMHWAWFLLAVVVFAAGEILSTPQAMAFVADWAPPEARGRYLSLYQAAWSVGFALNPALSLPLHAALGERAFWGLMPLVAIPGVSCCCASTGRRIGRRGCGGCRRSRCRARRAWSFGTRRKATTVRPDRRPGNGRVPVDRLRQSREGGEPEARVGKRDVTHDAEDPTPQVRVGRRKVVELAPGRDVAPIQDLRRVARRGPGGRGRCSARFTRKRRTSTAYRSPSATINDASERFVV